MRESSEVCDSIFVSFFFVLLGSFRTGQWEKEELGAGDRIEALTWKLLMTIKEDFVSGLGPKMW